MKQAIMTFLFVCLSISAQSQTYTGRVTDEKGTPLPYATVYLLQDPQIGTATNSDGIFTLQTGVSLQSQVIVSFLGYEKQELTLGYFADSVLRTVRLREQPLALEETVVSAKASKQKNRRKAMAQLLYKVYNRMQYDFSDEAYEARVVSDARMDSEGQPWGMEQMIARIVTIPRAATEGRDSVQLSGEVCKRFFDQDIRNRADSIYKDTELTTNMRTAASAVDSGVVVHKGLWALGNIRYDFEKLMDDVKHWSVSQENEGETVLTHTEKHNFLGIFKIVFRRHFIVDSETYRVRSFSEEADAKVFILFGYRIKGLYLDMLNLLNMDNERIEKFRLRRATAKVRLNTIYQEVDGHLYPKEKNLKADALITSTKKVDIPLNIRATQRVISVKTRDVRPMTEREMTRRMKRTIVELY
ncbi:MAG: carboxypeptidase-like regulatory domain-containing protein [Paludibacteraceae bacterium]|nr:carboxypeptidase-like regulatory domain-containing protein [Paludibacteraceae bacterium]